LLQRPLDAPVHSLIAVSAFLLTLLLADLAVAEQGSPPPEAIEAVRRGRELFDDGEFRRALAELVRAHELYPAPALLYNIARCHEELEQHCRAVVYYEDFLENGEPDSSVRREVERAIEDADHECRGSGSRGDGSGRGDRPDDAYDPPDHDEYSGPPADFSRASGRSSGESPRSFGAPSERSKRFRVAGVSLFVGGWILAVPGIVIDGMMHNQCNGNYGSLECEDKFGPYRPWDVVSFVVAGVVGAAGIALFVTSFYVGERRSARRPIHLALTPWAEGGLSVLGRF